MKPPWVPHPRESPVLPAAEQGWGEPMARIQAVAALLGLDPMSPPRPLPLCHHGGGVTPPGTQQRGRRRLTECTELRDAGALALGLGGCLAYLPLEGREEVLAKLLGHLHLQVGLHEEPKALVVDGLGRAEGRLWGRPGARGGGRAPCPPCCRVWGPLHKPGAASPAPSFHAAAPSAGHPQTPPQTPTGGSGQGPPRRGPEEPGGLTEGEKHPSVPLGTPLALCPFHRSAGCEGAAGCPRAGAMLGLVPPGLEAFLGTAQRNLLCGILESHRELK